MKTLSLVTLIALPTAAAAQGLASIGWLSSCWELNAPNRRVIEQWGPARGSEMRGNSRTIAGTREIEGERLRIYQVGDTLVYDARPSGQARTEFRAVLTSSEELVFENPRHDFPQRIVYRKVGSDSLVARIEGDRDNRRQPVTYAFKRVSCEGYGPSAGDAAESELQVLYDELVTMLDGSPAGLNTWFARYGVPTFSYVYWSTAGYRPPVVSKEQVDRAVAQQATSAQSALTDRTHALTIDRTLLRGDTAQVMLTLRLSHRFVDNAGRHGTAGERRHRTVEHQRIDSWVRSGGTWRLAEAQLIADETRVEGRPVMRNGRAVESP